MKKLLSIALVLVFVFALAGCMEAPNNNYETNNYWEEEEEDQESIEEEQADDDLLNLTTAQENAYASAMAYLASGNFSKKSLIRQLTDYEKFKLKDVRFAVRFIQKRGEVDWKQEAVDSARAYLDSSAFSKEGLYEQLVSEYGEQFTPKQARYAVNKVYK